jgi:hypothetical protein
MCVIWIYSMKTGRKQHAENCAVNRADDGIAGERTGACGTADEFIPAEAEPGSNYCSMRIRKIMVFPFIGLFS